MAMTTDALRTIRFTALYEDTFCHTALEELTSHYVDTSCEYQLLGKY